MVGDGLLSFILAWVERLTNVECRGASRRAQVIQTVRSPFSRRIGPFPDKKIKSFLDWPILGPVGRPATCTATTRRVQE